MDSDKFLPFIFNIPALEKALSKTLNTYFDNVLNGQLKLNISSLDPDNIDFIIQSNQTYEARLEIKWSESPDAFQIKFPVPIHGVFLIHSDNQHFSTRYLWHPLLVEKPGERVVKKYRDDSTSTLWYRKTFWGERYWQLPIDHRATASEEKSLKTSVIGIAPYNDNRAIPFSVKDKNTLRNEFISQAAKEREKHNKSSTSDEQYINHKRLWTYSAYFLEKFFNILINGIASDLKRDPSTVFQEAINNKQPNPTTEVQEKIWQSLLSLTGKIERSIFPFKSLTRRSRLQLFDPLNNIDAVSQLTAFQRYNYSEYLPLVHRQNHPSFRNFICPIETPESKEIGITQHLIKGVQTDVYGNLYPSDGVKEYFGYGTSLIPFFQHDDAARVMMGAKNLRQALPLAKAEEPWVTTGREDDIPGYLKPAVKQGILSKDFSEFKPGVNLLVAYMPWYGFNFEDAIVANKRLVDEDIMTWRQTYEYSTYIKPGYQLCKPDSNQFISFYDRKRDYLYKTNTIVTPDISIANFQNGDHIYQVKCGGDGSGILIAINYQEPADPRFGGLLSWTVQITKRLEVGDKLMARYGNKGVISTLLPESELPKLPDDERLPENLRGRAVDLILNPHGVISRMNLGQLIETHYGLVKALGFSIPNNVGQAFTPIDADALKKDICIDGLVDKYGKMQLLLPNGEKTSSPVAVGYQYIVRLNHIPSRKVNVRRGAGPNDKYNLVTGQPVSGRQLNGGQRFGEMDIWALAAHQATGILKEVMTRKSDPWSWETDTVSDNQTYQAIKDHLYALGVTINESGQVQTVSDEDVREWNPVKNHVLRTKAYISSFSCSKCSYKLLDEKELTSHLKNQRTGAVLLTVEDLLLNYGYRIDTGDIINDEDNCYLKVNDLINKVSKRIDFTYSKSLSQIHFKIDSESFVAYSRHEKNAKTQTPIIKWRLVCPKHKSKPLDCNNERTKLLPVAGGLYDPAIFGIPSVESHSYIDWGYIELPFKIDNNLIPGPGHIIQNLPVLPLKYRYVSPTVVNQTGFDHIISQHYSDIYSLVQEYYKTSEDKESIDFIKGRISKSVNTLLEEIKERLFGIKGNAKNGLIRKHGLGFRADYSGRLVIVPDPSLKWDECGVPSQVLMVLYGEKIAEWINTGEFDPKYNKLFNIIFGDTYLIDDEKKLNKDKALFSDQFWQLYSKIDGENSAFPELAHQLILDFLTDHTNLRVLLNRQPTLHKYNIMSFRPVPIFSNAMVLKINPLICKAFGADFDGDEMAIHALISEDSIIEADKLSPVNITNMTSVADGQPLADFDQDFVLGHYLLTGEDKEQGLEKIKGMNPDEIQAAMNDSFKAVTEAGVSFGFLELLELVVSRTTVVESNKQLELQTIQELSAIKNSADAPGYNFAIMALSGARGRKQSSQIISSRGFLSPGAVGFESKASNFIIPESLVEGMSIDSSFWAAMNARSSMSDKQIGTAKAGDLMRKLVLALWPWHSVNGNCGKNSIIDCACIKDKKVCTACCGTLPGFDIVPDNYPIGLIAAQSIGERGTQLSMQGFHTGERAFTIKDVERLLDLNKSDLNTYKDFKGKFLKIDAYKRLDERHIILLWLALTHSDNKSLASAWDDYCNTLGVIAGPDGFRRFVKLINNMSSDQEIHPIEKVLMGLDPA